MAGSFVTWSETRFTVLHSVLADKGQPLNSNAAKFFMPSSIYEDPHNGDIYDQPHGIAVDSKGNVYVAENRGKRVQKFRIMGQ